MTPLEDRLGRDLVQIADHATISGSAWEQIRSRIDETTDEPKGEIIMVELEDTPVEKRRGRTSVWLVSAAAGLLIAVAAISLIARRDDERLAASPDPQVVIDQYINAFNSGDVDRAIGLFATDATLTDGDGSATRSPTITQWEALLTWYAAQEARIVDAECGPIESANTRGIVVCRWNLQDAVTEAIDRPGDVVETEWTIDGEQIVAFERTIDWSVHPHASFLEWVSSNHPDDYGSLRRFPFDLTAAEAQRAGEIVARHAPDWATYFFSGPAAEPADN